MRKICFMALSLLLSMSSFAQYEKADAVYHKLLKEYTLNQDGSWNYHYEKELELLTHFAFHRLYGETFIVYNPEMQNLKINRAYTIMKDGSKVKTPENAFNEVLPHAAANAPAFSQLREMVVTHTALEVGAVIHLDYTLENNKDLYPAFMGRDLIGEVSPVEEMILRVKVPQGTTLNHRTYNIRTAPEISKENGQDIYTWKFKNVKAAPHEAYQSNAAQPMVLFSAAGDLHRVYDRFVNQEAFRYQAGSEVMEKTRELSDKDGNDLQTMINIQKFVQNELATYHVNLQETAFKVRPPDQVWKSNAGTPLEKAILMTAMLRQANINASVVAVIDDKFYDREMGNLLVMEDFPVQVNPRQYDQYYLSADGQPVQNLKYTLEGKQLLILDAAIESLRTFAGEAYENSADVEYELNWSSDNKINGKVSAKFEYYLNPYLQIVHDTAAAKKLFKGISGKEFTGFEIEKATEKTSAIAATFEKEDPFMEQSGYFFLKLPEVETKMPDHFLAMLPSERESILQLPFPVTLDMDYSLELPDNYVAVTPDQADISNELGSVRISYKIKEHQVKIEKELVLKQRNVQPAQYAALRELMNHWYDEKYSQLVLKKTLTN